MFPLILAGLAAVVLVGCGGSSAKQAQTPSGGTPPPDPESARDPVLSHLQSGLRTSGVEDAELDQGCDLINYALPGPNMRRVNLFAGKVEACEVYQYALDRQARFGGLLAGANRAPLPWTLNAENRARVQSAIQKIDRLLLTRKILPASESYRYSMAMALFYFSLYPSTLKFAEANPDLKRFRNLKRDLAEFESQLPGFDALLKSNQGLGIVEMREDAPQEAGADQALFLKQGKCSEISKILYAVFREAGLSPYFIFVRGKEVGENWLKWGAELSEQARGEMLSESHVYLGIDFDSRKLYFDPNGFVMEEPYPNSYPMKLSHYWAGDKWNQVQDQINGRQDPNRLAGLGRQIVNLDPLSPFGALTWGLSHAMREDWDESLWHFNQAARLDPFSNYQSYIGTALGQRGYPGDRKRAIRILSEALEYNPGNHMAKENLELFLMYEGYNGILR